MLRIITGKHKNRRLETLEGMNTRPMMDRMKESVFNTIGPYFDGDIVLDLFGGSGALSLESISRGCSKAYIVELNYNALNVIKRNVSSLKEEASVQIYNLDYQKALNIFKEEKKSFDIVFLDPPYRLNLIEEIITFLLENKMVNKYGIIVCQYVKGNFKPFENDVIKILKNYTYASSEVCIYQMNN